MKNNNDNKFILIIDCPEKIPCNPCEDQCPKKVIKVGKTITNIPEVLDYSRCIGCGNCVANCPGQAIFLVNLNYANRLSTITFPYEFNEELKIGQSVIAIDNNGKKVCIATILSIKQFKKTKIVTLVIPRKKYELVKGLKISCKMTT